MRRLMDKEPNATKAERSPGKFDKRDVSGTGHNQLPRPTLVNEATCPCCGATVEKDRLYVDLASNTITYRKRRWIVTARTAEFAYLLAQAWPSTLKDADAKRKIFGTRTDSLHSTDLSVMAHSLRYMLLPLGGTVGRMRKEGGYRLSLPILDDEV